MIPHKNHAIVYFERISGYLDMNTDICNISTLTNCSISVYSSI